MTTPDFNDLTPPDWMVKVWSLNAAPEGVTDEEWDALVERLWDKHETVDYLGERFMLRSEWGMSGVFWDGARRAGSSYGTTD
jgi:hypothetical protein